MRPGTKFHVDGADVGQRIRECRKARGLTQKKLANAAGVEIPTLWRYENNGMLPRIDVLAPIAIALGESIDYLVTGSRRDETSGVREYPSALLEFIASEPRVTEAHRGRLKQADWYAFTSRLGIELSVGLVRSVWTEMVLAEQIPREQLPDESKSAS